MSNPGNPGGAVVITHDDTPVIIDDTSSMNVRCRGLVRSSGKLKSLMEMNALAIYRASGHVVTAAVGAFAPVTKVVIELKGGGPPKTMTVDLLPGFDMDTSGEIGNFDPPGSFDHLGRAIETLKNLNGSACRIQKVTVTAGGVTTPLTMNGNDKTILVFSQVHG